MEFGFRETQAFYNSRSQNARVWTEEWAAQWLYCPNCGNAQLTRFTANLPVADLFCGSCSDQYELKSKKSEFGSKIANGAYGKKIERLASNTNPNFILLKYNSERREVVSVCMIPKHFFTPDIVEARPPLGPHARRAGWIGSNIVISHIPDAGRIYLVRDGIVTPRELVVSAWQRTRFLREASSEARGWLLDVMKCLDQLGRREFDIDDAYSFESSLSQKYPNNRNVKPKIRQQLQYLRDRGYLVFTGRGRYRLTV
ncbi:Type-2 restriction enzyme DpnI [Mesorhizobium sp. ORS 3359]|nr:Type-2 restriction enzyme DpnI [Mesorhizobium sp. ORS 3359]